MNTIHRIQSLSSRMIDAQAPIRILKALHWSDDVREEFLASGGSRLPKVDREWYRDRPLGFEPSSVIVEFERIERDVKATLGAAHPAGAILLRMCHECRTVAQMLQHRGEPEFGQLSRVLYGSSGDPLLPGEPPLGEFSRRIRQAVRRIEPCLNVIDEDDLANIPSEQAAKMLQVRLAASMGSHGPHMMVSVDDRIASEAAADGYNIKLRRGTLFSRRKLRLLEVHEGWVHVGTTLNGRAQAICQFLAKGTPSSTVTQEGLAVLVETLTLSSSPARQERVNNRIIAIEMAEHGADFLDVYRFFVEQGMTSEDSYGVTMRAFRGSTPEGAPFTKDLAYTRGFISVYNFLRAAIGAGALDRIPLIFCGKIVLDEIGLLCQLRQDGLLENPVFLPPHFADLHGLAAWMSYDLALTNCSCATMQQGYMKQIQ